MPIREEIKELILQGASVLELKSKAVSLGMKTLRASGLLKIKEGMTSLEEVLENTFPDNQ
jgi:type IV pilus assembly protein PilB